MYLDSTEDRMQQLSFQYMQSRTTVMKVIALQIYTIVLTEPGI